MSEETEAALPLDKLARVYRKMPQRPYAGFGRPPTRAIVKGSTISP